MQVTKLCDLGVDDCVCSVGWAQRGTHLAVGTNNGKVQVRVYELNADHAWCNCFHLSVFDGIFGNQRLLYFSFFFFLIYLC